jgi:hypothetical protein
LPLAGLKLPAAFDTSTQTTVLSGYVTSKVTSAPFENKLLVPPRMTLPHLLPVTAN